MDINVFAKFYEIPSLHFQDIEKPKCRGQMDGLTDGRTKWKQYTTPQTQFAGGIININCKGHDMKWKPEKYEIVTIVCLNVV